MRHAGHKRQRPYGWHALELGNEEPARAQPSVPSTHSPLRTLPQPPSVLILADHVGLASAKTKMDSGHDQGAQVWPHHGPWRARSPSGSRSRLLAAGLSPQPAPTGAEPANPCRPWPAASRAELSGAHRRSLWRDVGSEKLWMREMQGSVCSQEPPRPRKQSCTAPGRGNRLVLWLLQPSGWHQAGTTAQACLAVRGTCTALDR